eukprot:1944030-Prymnesium_polylepis.1
MPMKLATERWRRVVHRSESEASRVWGRPGRVACTPRPRDVRSEGRSDQPQRLRGSGRGGAPGGARERDALGPVELERADDRDGDGMIEDDPCRSPCHTRQGDARHWGVYGARQTRHNGSYGCGSEQIMPFNHGWLGWPHSKRPRGVPTRFGAHCWRPRKASPSTMVRRM